MAGEAAGDEHDGQPDVFLAKLELKGEIMKSFLLIGINKYQRDEFVEECINSGVEIHWSDIKYKIYPDGSDVPQYYIVYMVDADSYIRKQILWDIDWIKKGSASRTCRHCGKSQKGVFEDIVWEDVDEKETSDNG